MEDVAVYGYITPLKVKIVIALPLSDMVVRDVDIIPVSVHHLLHCASNKKLYVKIFKALHMAYYSSISNPFLKLNHSGDPSSDQSSLLAVGSPKWKNFKRRVDEISWLVGQVSNTSSS